MIKLLRVDHRLLHGQVIFGWVSELNVDCILIPSDTIINDPVRFKALKMTKPVSVKKLIIKSVQDSIDAINSGVTDKYNLMIITENVLDAYKLAKACNRISTINLGGAKKREDTKQINKSIFLTKDEINCLKEILTLNKTINIQAVPDEKKIQVTDNML